jgi:uncharacterized repeat protein (TIGR02543 family)
VTNGGSCAGALVIPEGVTSIGSSAFEYAQGLTSVTIPASVTYLADYAFYVQNALSEVYFAGNAPASVGTEVFEGIASGAKAHISATATGFGTEATWNGLIIDRADSASYTVTYNSASGSAVASGVVTQGGSIQAAPVSTRAGYTLTGWSATSNGSVLTFPYTPTADITLYAIWTGTTTPVTPPTTKPTTKPTTTLKKTAISSYAAKFSSGSSVVSQTGKTTIKKIVSKSGKDAKYTVTGVATKVAGVSDSRVEGLAKARAEKVKAYLIKLGVKKSNISIKVKIVESGITPKTVILAKYLTK